MDLLTGFLIGLALAAAMAAVWRTQKTGWAWVIAAPAVYFVAQDWLSRRFTLRHLRYETVIAGFYIVGAAIAYLRGRGLRWAITEDSFPTITGDAPPSLIERIVAVGVCLGLLALCFATLTSYPPISPGEAD